MGWETVLFGFAAGVAIAVVTTPVGVSGAVFLLPVQLDLLHVPSPQVTPTNLLFNVIAIPGALARYRRHGQLSGPLTRLLVFGTLPGVVVGAVVRVYLIPGIGVFRMLAAMLFVATGTLILARLDGRTAPATSPRQLHDGPIIGLGLIVGVVGGIYGIGGGSIIAPILVGLGTPVGIVAPAALTTTLLTSIVGALTYAALSLVNDGHIAPNWLLGISCGAGGLVGGYLGARLQPHLPDRALRALLGILAVTLGITYVLRSIQGAA